MSCNISETNKRKPLLDFHWTARHIAYQHFYQDFASATWDPESKIKANSLLLSITEFEFIIVFLIIYQFLSHLAGITVKLQGTEVDIMEAYNQIDDIKSCYKTIRENVNIEFHKVYLQAERMGESVNVDPSKPRSCARQRNRPNAAAENIEDWYRINVAIPFIDHIITELDSQFSGWPKLYQLFFD